MKFIKIFTILFKMECFLNITFSFNGYLHLISSSCWNSISFFISYHQIKIYQIKLLLEYIKSNNNFYIIEVKFWSKENFYAILPLTQ